MPTAPRRSASDAAEKNRPLVEDIRLLGRILGDVIREQEGKDAFELIERVRKLSVAYRLKSDAQAGYKPMACFTGPSKSRNAAHPWEA